MPALVSCQRTQIDKKLLLAVLPEAITVLNKLSLRGEGEENKQVHLRSIKNMTLRPPWFQNHIPKMSLIMPDLFRTKGGLIFGLISLSFQ